MHCSHVTCLTYAGILNTVRHAMSCYVVPCMKWAARLAVLFLPCRRMTLLRTTLTAKAVEDDGDGDGGQDDADGDAGEDDVVEDDADGDAGEEDADGHAGEDVDATLVRTTPTATLLRTMLTATLAATTLTTT